MNFRRFQRIMRRGLRLRCPRCGEATLFAGFFAMHSSCAHCGLKFEREPGYFVGAIYINYAVTAVAAIGGFLLLERCANPSLTTQMILWCAFAVVFPLWFYRYSKSIWLAFDYLFNPEDPDLRVIRGRAR